MRRALVFFWTGLSAAAGCALLGASMEPLIIYNRSPSAPVGFYIRTFSAPAPGDFVTLPVPESVRAYAAMRQFGDASDRFLKRVAAMEGEVVCAESDRVLVDGALRAHRSSRDSAGRLLPTWRGCVELAASDVFLLGDGDDSFDGRYWGVSARAEIDGVWRPLGPRPLS